MAMRRDGSGDDDGLAVPPGRQGRAISRRLLNRMIRTLGPGEHFGELAARDWGGGYGYARTATVRCAQDGQLLRLSSDDFQWLVQTQPAVRAELANILADRLRQR